MKWKPGFTGTKENYRIRVYENATPTDNGTLVYDTGSNEQKLQDDLSLCETGKWFRIAVFPLGSDGADKNVIDFIISYYQEWTTQYIHLYINGEYDRIRWPYSGSNPKIIGIKHVSPPETSEIDE